VFQPIYAIIAQLTQYKPEQEEKARLVLENYALELILSMLSIYQNNFLAELKS